MTSTQFKLILKEIKLKYSEKEFKEFLKIYGKSQKTSGFICVSIDSLVKCVHSSGPSLSNRSTNMKSKAKKKISLIKTHSFSTRASSNLLEESSNKLNNTLQHNHIPFEIALPKSLDKKVFFEHLLEIFHDPEITTQYFFINREPFINFEDFLASIQALGLKDVYPDLKKLFESLSKSKIRLEKIEFYTEIFNFQCVENQGDLKLLHEIRGKIVKTFGSYIKAFEEISCGNSFISVVMLETVIKKLNILLEKDQISLIFERYFPNGKMYFKDFKEFWIGKEGVCLIKSCEEITSEGVLYCKRHFQCILVRGEEIYNKLENTLKKDQFTQICAKIMHEKIKNGVTFNGILLEKRDLQALREILRFKSKFKPRNSTSVKCRM